MVISDLNYLEVASANVEGGFASSTAYSTGTAVGLFPYASTKASTKAVDGFYGFDYSSSKTSAKASAVYGGVAVTSSAGSIAV